MSPVAVAERIYLEIKQEDEEMGFHYSRVAHEDVWAAEHAEEYHCPECGHWIPPETGFFDDEWICNDCYEEIF